MKEEILVPRQKSLKELEKKLKDPKWRLNNLYHIKNEKGQKIKFKMRPAQEEIFDNLWYFNIIPKARQLGVTTFFCMLYLDRVLFGSDVTAGIIAHRAEDMRKIFRNNIKFALDNLPDWLKEKIGKPDISSANEIVFPNGSTIFVSLSTRGGTVQYLHVSEFGYICAHNPHKAEEIVTGAINSVHTGMMVSIESTAKGREGYFFDFCMAAKRMQEEGKTLTPLDFKLFFFAWWIDDRYTLPGEFDMSDEMKVYFDLLEAKEKIKLTDGQKHWYIKKKTLNGDKMKTEFPSTLEEAFEVSLEGTYYSTQMEKVFTSGRIMKLPVDTMVPVDTYWDLGMNDFNVILFVQSVGPQIRFIDMYWNHGESPAHYVDVMNEYAKTRGYRYGRHFMPWDAEIRDVSSGGESRRQIYMNSGLRPINTAPKLRVEDGRDKVKLLFSKFFFDETKCQQLITAMQNYRREWDSKMGVWKNKHRHDENSHFADAARTLAVVWKENFQHNMLTGEDREYEQADENFFA